MVRKMATTVISIAVKIMLVAAVVCLLYYGGTKGFEFGTLIFTPSVMEEAPGTDIEVTIKKGMSVKDIGKMLEEKGLIEDYKIFWIQATLYEYEFGAGSYSLNTSMSSEDMLKVLKVTKTED